MVPNPLTTTNSIATTDQAASAYPVVLAVELISHHAWETDRLGSSDAEVVVIPNVDGARGVIPHVGDTEGVDVEGNPVLIDVDSVAVAQVVVACAVAVPRGIAVDRQNAASHTSRGVTFAFQRPAPLTNTTILAVGYDGAEMALTAHDLGAEKHHQGSPET
ncbi:hypothetical protein SLS62_004908 [Diatrype stigma]|uniref:Uncharacterized protein n=1 Tax=Diatrype stigma TaxID=117547 RepID=A0AAN9UVW0_9PEZI